ncbi:MAG TPA: glutamate racemase [Candidatus Saccharimonadales bacterium]|nr:glutamate racemase [Candidatus Saccharimonadales bacterium]
MKIGVFDSGAGGLHVAQSVQEALPEHEILYAEDREHVPYGTRDIGQIHDFVLPILQALVDQDCGVILIACNTVTTNLIGRLRDELNVPLVGMEPMVKPAAEATKTGVIAVCATPRTLSSDRYRWLRDTYAKNVVVLEPDCSDWALMVETDNLDRKKVSDIVDDACAKNADQIVLGCTHYHWIEEIIQQMAAGRAKVIQPEQAVIKQLKRVIDQNETLQV